MTNLISQCGRRASAASRLRLLADLFLSRVSIMQFSVDFKLISIEIFCLSYHWELNHSAFRGVSSSVFLLSLA